MSEHDAMETIRMICLIGLFMAAFSSGAFAYECYSGGTGAVSWWTLDDAQHTGTTAIDICGYANGTEVNTPTTGETGVFGESYKFTDADNDLINAKTSAIPLGDMSEGSANLWVNVDDWSSAGDKYALYISEDPSTTTNKLGIHHDAVVDRWEFNYKGGGVVVFINDADSTPRRNWIMITEVWSESNNNISVFINGTLLTSTTFNTDFSANAEWLTIGSQSYVSSLNFDGWIDEVSIYNTTLYDFATENGTKITNLFNYNNVSGLTGGGGGGNCIPTLYDMHDKDNPDGSSPMDVVFKAIDDVALTWVKMEIDGTNYTYTPANNTNVTDTNYTWGGPAEGNESVIVYCLGDSGVEVASSVVEYHYDTQNPLSYWYNPLKNNSTDWNYTSDGFQLNISTGNHHLKYTTITISNESDYSFIWWNNETQCTGACQGVGVDWMNFTNTITNLTSLEPTARYYIRVKMNDTADNQVTEHGYFDVLANSDLTFSFGQFYNTITGWFYAEYDDLTATMIEDANCTMTIITPSSVSTDYNMSNLTEYYRLVYTPASSGTYNYSVECSHENYTTQEASGTFNVLTEPATTNIQLTDQTTLEGYSSKSCTGEKTLTYVFESETCLEAECYDMTKSKEVWCELGCHNATGTCRESLSVQPLEVWLALIILTILIIFNRKMIRRRLGL